MPCCTSGWSSRGGSLSHEVVEVVAHGGRPEEVEVTEVVGLDLRHRHGRAVLQLGKSFRAVVSFHVKRLLFKNNKLLPLL